MTAEIRHHEQECLRRLDYVDAQLRRIARTSSPWRSAMTVMDVDIMPLGRATRVFSAVKRMPDWKRRYVLGGLAAFFLVFFVLLVIRC